MVSYEKFLQLASQENVRGVVPMKTPIRASRKFKPGYRIRQLQKTLKKCGGFSQVCQCPFSRILFYSGTFLLFSLTLISRQNPQPHQLLRPMKLRIGSIKEVSRTLTQCPIFLPTLRSLRTRHRLPNWLYQENSVNIPILWPPKA